MATKHAPVTIAQAAKSRRREEMRSLRMPDGVCIMSVPTPPAAVAMPIES
jgi:hypothetical protein